MLDSVISICINASDRGVSNSEPSGLVVSDVCRWRFISEYQFLLMVQIIKRAFNKN